MWLWEAVAQTAANKSRLPPMVLGLKFKFSETAGLSLRARLPPNPLVPHGVSGLLLVPDPQPLLVTIYNWLERDQEAITNCAGITFEEIRIRR